jgi:DNA-binding transcriptional regulator YiaG
MIADLVRETINEHGGDTAFAELVGVSVRTVSMWKLRGKFPSDRYESMSALLPERPPEAWGQK